MNRKKKKHEPWFSKAKSFYKLYLLFGDRKYLEIWANLPNGLITTVYLTTNVMGYWVTENGRDDKWCFGADSLCVRFASRAFV